jgi:hypothetical protein
LDFEPNVTPLAYEIPPAPRRRPWLGTVTLLAALVSLAGGLLYTTAGIVGGMQIGIRHPMTVFSIVVGLALLCCAWVLVRQGMSLFLWRLPRRGDAG